MYIYIYYNVFLSYPQLLGASHPKLGPTPRLRPAAWIAWSPRILPTLRVARQTPGLEFAFMA